MFSSPSHSHSHAHAHADADSAPAAAAASVHTSSDLPPNSLSLPRRSFAALIIPEDSASIEPISSLESSSDPSLLSLARVNSAPPPVDLTSPTTPQTPAAPPAFAIKIRVSRSSESNRTRPIIDNSSPLATSVPSSEFLKSPTKSPVKISPPRQRTNSESLFSPSSRRCIFYPLSPETLFFIQYFPSLLNTPPSDRSRFSSFFNRVFVCPLANLTNFSISYQMYLSEIFHTKLLTKFTHYFCMPLVNLFFAIFLSQWNWQSNQWNYKELFSSVSGSVSSSSSSPLISDEMHGISQWNGGDVYCIVLFLWYLVWGFVAKIPIMGILMIPILLIIQFTSNEISNKIYDYSNTNSNPFWNPTGEFITNPVLLLFVCAFFQALGHIAEPRLPPRVSGSTEWLEYSAVIKMCGAPAFALRCITQTAFGTFDEFLASPRLMPILTLRLYFAAGFAPETWDPIKKLVEMALDSGNPALDYIGSGGDQAIEQAIEHDEIIRIRSIK